MDGLNSSKGFWSCATSYGLHENAVAVIVVDYEHVVVPRTGCDNKLAGLVRMNLTSRRFEYGREALVSACIVEVTGGKRVFVGIGLGYRRCRYSRGYGRFG